MDLLALANSSETISEKSGGISAATLRHSKDIREPNFKSIDTDDIARLFALYDQEFFAGSLAAMVIEKTGNPITFRLSPTMTRAGGKTIRTQTRQWRRIQSTHYEIAIGSRLLFMTFNDIRRPVMVCGLNCENRLQALQRIMEHEMLHLAEMLTWGKSSCSGKRFKLLARNIFGHAGTRHDLVTPRERAEIQHNVRIGQEVEFEFAGSRQIGKVNRIHHRATVLVPSATGMPYSDGKRYLKFYIPLPRLKPAAVDSSR